MTSYDVVEVVLKAAASTLRDACNEAAKHRDGASHVTAHLAQKCEDKLLVARAELQMSRINAALTVGFQAADIAQTAWQFSRVAQVAAMLGDLGRRGFSPLSTGDRLAIANRMTDVHNDISTAKTLLADCAFNYSEAQKYVLRAVVLVFEIEEDADNVERAERRKVNLPSIQGPK